MDVRSFQKYLAQHGEHEFLIEEDLPGIGWYLYVTHVASGQCIADHLQHTLEITKNFAYEKYGVQKDNWRRI